MIKEILSRLFHTRMDRWSRPVSAQSHLSVGVAADLYLEVDLFRSESFRVGIGILSSIHFESFKSVNISTQHTSFLRNILSKGIRSNSVGAHSESKSFHPILRTNLGVLGIRNLTHATRVGNTQSWRACFFLHVCRTHIVEFHRHRQEDG